MEFTGTIPYLGLIYLWFTIWNIHILFGTINFLSSIYFAIESIQFSIVIWRNIFCNKAFICKLSIDSVYIRTLCLQRSFLGCLHILGPITIFYARSFYNIFYTSILGVWSTTSFMIPNFIFSLDHLSLSTTNPWRFL